ncbi:MAG: thioredoxin fold domain-containing protein [Microscillaceae bacterium]|nr:thioredoxin fold domain-containing protein [Microscillaceae bacterium]
MRLKNLRKPIFSSLVLMVAFGWVISRPALAFNEELTFFKGTWPEALQEAKKQNKVLFVDAYAVWCGPCKYMDKYVFTDAEVARYFNAQFINYKLDVDVEEQLAVNFEIEAMPTYLFVDASETVVFRKTGAMDAEAFLELGKNALEIPNLEKQYQSGDRSPTFIQKYLLAFRENISPLRQVVADEYFAKLAPEALLEEANFDLLAAYVRNPAAPAFLYYLEHLAKFIENLKTKPERLPIMPWMRSIMKPLKPNRRQS